MDRECFKDCPRYATGDCCGARHDQALSFHQKRHEAGNLLFVHKHRQALHWATVCFRSLSVQASNFGLSVHVDRDLSSVAKDAFVAETPLSPDCPLRSVAERIFKELNSQQEPDLKKPA